MAVSEASKTYMTNILDKNTLMLTLYGCLEVKWYKTINENMVLIQIVEI